MEPHDLDVVSYQRLKALMEQLEQQPHIKDRLDDATISFEFIVGSLFPDIYQAFQERLQHEHTLGFIEGAQSTDASTSLTYHYCKHCGYQDYSIRDWNWCPNCGEELNEIEILS